MTDKKVCPMMFNQPTAYCIEGDCAWWCKWAHECSIPLTAGILADSSICQSYFEGGKVDE